MCSCVPRSGTGGLLAGQHSCCAVPLVHKGREQTAATTVLRGLGPTGLYLLDTIPQRHLGKARSFLFFVLIRLLREPLTPEMLSRLQALGPDLLLRGVLPSGDPSDSELGLRMVVLNYNLVSNLHFASITTQLHAMVADIESMREMDVFTSNDPESHWYNRFGSLRPPFAIDARGTGVTAERSMGNGLWVPLPRPLN